MSLVAIRFFCTPRITPRSQHRARLPLIPDLSLYLAPVHLPVLYYGTPKPPLSPRATSASPLLAQSLAPLWSRCSATAPPPQVDAAALPWSQERHRPLLLRLRPLQQPPPRAQR
ncbi:hypothetical protein PVAP13_7KG101054 [Panicum virgatum]|uniref:Uncharacterized protein n=1 Tax=Panicum virgatum TaxID=38727 RepID=A0A8T0QBJ4_PANVG|nr:hypothetical protein PVAP13_7KG101054 [Panicum virgatum]